MIEEVLAQFGLDPEETQVYLRLLETGPRSAGNLARDLATPRATLYGTLYRLANLGLVSESNSDAVKVFAAAPPERINQLFEQKLDSLQSNQRQFASLLPALEHSLPTTLMSPKFQVYKGPDQLTHILKDMLLYYDLETLAFWPIRDLIDVLPQGFTDYHNRIRIRHNLSIRAIWPRSQVVDFINYPYLGGEPELKRQLRIAPEGVTATMGYWIYGKRVAFLSSRRENVGFIIESAEMVETLKSHFEVLWQISTPAADHPPATDLENFIDGI